jgi:Predicted transcriptional regulators
MEEYKKYRDQIKKQYISTRCPIRQALDILQGKWTARVIYSLLKNNSMRFGEIKKTIPTITNTMLTSTLRELESQNIVSRIQYNEIPPRVEYSLTEKGISLLPVFFELGKWGNKYDS